MTPRLVNATIQAVKMLAYIPENQVIQVEHASGFRDRQ